MVVHDLESYLFLNLYKLAIDKLLSHVSLDLYQDYQVLEPEQERESKFNGMGDSHRPLLPHISLVS